MTVLTAFRQLAGPLLAVVLLLCQNDTLAAQVPAAPSGAVSHASRPGDLAIVVFWTDNATNEDGFEVQRCIGNDFATFATVYVSPYGNLGGYADVGLAENTAYSYRVRAFNAAGASDFSNITSAKTSYSQPLQVTKLTAAHDAGAVELNWVDVSDNETRFEVERLEPGVSLQYEIIATLAPDTTRFLDTTALDGTVYQYRVRPWRYDVFGGSEDAVSVTTGPALNVVLNPDARTKSDMSIQLKWKGHFRDDVLVQIQRTDPWFGFLSTIAVTSAHQRKYLDEGLPSGTFFQYRIRIVTDTAVSTWETINATTSTK